MINKADGLQKIKELVTRFNEQLPAYKKSDYNETQTRRDFIDPFFKALGWDIDNAQGAAESYREVIHEDKVKVGKATKAPDYSFRLGGGQRLFFVEAKKPSVLIKDDIQPAYQVRRYGWSAKLSVSVITDFEEFAIYDCTKKPNPADKTSVARVKYITFTDYENEWDFLWSTFSKEAVLKGSFDKFIGSNANKKGTATVDKAFLTSLDEWRTLLAETISKENKQLDEDELNFVVQQTLDRIIFLRICEDRSIEPYGSLQAALKTGDYYQNLLKEFKQADDKYNSGLFDFKKDTLSKQLVVNNKTLKTIINQLYYPECPYEFSVLSVEILGSAYEQFLGKTITINNRGKAVIELKPEVRKAGGVYYTPQYIVDYIVQNTIGKLVENKTPIEIAALKIVDPACGSGSFLLGAYQFLLNWHIDYYTKNPKEATKVKAFVSNVKEGFGGDLSTSIKKQILLNNIYGVDIDTNAVEVTKLSLLLKCMEGETQASIAHQMTMFKERVLPTLENNIKSGNSLIDTDYYDNQLDFGEERKIKPFSWQKAFPEVFKVKKENKFLQLVNDFKKLNDSTIQLNAAKAELVQQYYDTLKTDKITTDEFIKRLEKKNNLLLSPEIKKTIIEIENPLAYVPKAMLKLPELVKPNIPDAVITNYNDFINLAIDSLVLVKELASSYTVEFAYFELLVFKSDMLKELCKKNEMDFKDLYSALISKFIKHLQDNFDSYEKFYLQNTTENNGGFDVVIGNPPYVKEYTSKDSFEQIKKSHLKKYYQGKMDLWYFFACYGIDLLKQNGKLGYIVPNNWVSNSGASILRNKLLEDSTLINLVDFGSYMVFENASIQTMVMILEKNKSIEYKFDYRKLEIEKPTINDAHGLLSYNLRTGYKLLLPLVKKEDFLNKFLLFGDDNNLNLLTKILTRRNFNLNKDEVANGIHPHYDFISKSINEKHKNIFENGEGIFGLSEKEYKRLQLNKNEQKLIKPYYNNSDNIGRYYFKEENDKWLIYTNSDFKNKSMMTDLPNLKNHLDKYKNVITSDNKPYGLHRSREEKFFTDKKIIALRKCTNRPVFSYTEKPAYISATFYIIKSDKIDLVYLTGLLNSKLIAYWLRNKGKMQGNNYQLDKEPLLEIPIFVPLDIKQQTQIINHVTQLLQLNKDLHTANLETKKEQMKQKIEYNEDKINTLVYSLYNLTEEEIKIIEGN